MGRLADELRNLVLSPENAEKNISELENKTSIIMNRKRGITASFLTYISTRNLILFSKREEECKERYDDCNPEFGVFYLPQTNSLVMAAIDTANMAFVPTEEEVEIKYIQ